MAIHLTFFLIIIILFEDLICNLSVLTIEISDAHANVEINNFMQKSDVP